MGWPLSGNMLGATTAHLATIMEAIALAINQRQAILIRGEVTEGSFETSFYYTDALSNTYRKRRPTAADFKGAWIHGPCIRRFVIDAQSAIDALVQVESTPGSFQNPVFLIERGGITPGNFFNLFWTRDLVGSEDNDFHTEIGAWLDVDDVGVLRAELWQQMIDGLNLLTYVCTSNFSGSTPSGTHETAGQLVESGSGNFPADGNAACALRPSISDAIEGAIDDMTLTSSSSSVDGTDFLYRNTWSSVFCDGDEESETPTAENAILASVQYAREEVSFDTWASRRIGRATGDFVQFIASFRSRNENLSAADNQIIDLIFCETETFTPVAYPDTEYVELNAFPTTISVKEADPLEPLSGILPQTVFEVEISQEATLIAAVTDISNLLDDQS